MPMRVLSYCRVRVPQSTHGRAVIYTRREVGVMAFVAGLLVGTVLGLSSCEPTPVDQHITTTSAP